MLRCAELEVVGRLVEASNITLYGRLRPDDGSGLPADGVSCVYKPVRGERPLWDFPRGTLSRREVAAFALSEATGWEIVPPTVWRDGPFGPGMVQLWVDADDSVDLLGLVRGGDPALRRMALYDAVANNADRKGGHLLPVAGGHVYGVDHGICFHREPKLRTILWGWRGSSISPDERAVLRGVHGALDGDLGATLSELLADDEVAATRRRVDDLLADGCFPEPDPDRPAIPWPPF